MAVVATPGAANANSFATEAEFTAYWDSRPFATVPAAATANQKTAALIAAGRLLNGAFIWTGAAADGVQAMTWPRSGMLTRNGYEILSTVIPQELKDAQCELAGQWLSADRTADNEAEKQGIKSVKAGSVAVEFHGKSNRQGTSFDDLQAAIAGAGSDLYYLSRAVPDAVRWLLVPSWYEHADLSFGAEFDVVSPL